MKKIYGATVPPKNGGFLPTNNSKTNNSNRYCIHDVNCSHYIKSKNSGNTINFEASSIKEMEEYINELPELPGGIQKCGVCLKDEA